MLRGGGGEREGVGRECGEGDGGEEEFHYIVYISSVGGGLVEMGQSKGWCSVFLDEVVDRLVFILRPSVNILEDVCAVYSSLKG